MKSIKEKEITSLKGVGEATAEKLQQANFNYVMSVAVASPSQIVEATGIGIEAARKLVSQAIDMCDLNFSPAKDILERRKEKYQISTGVEDFDRILDGGFEAGCINEVFGAYGTGKTQIAHQLAVNAYLEDNKSVTMFIDTENTFRPERIMQFSKGKDVDGEKVLKNIHVARAYNSDHQMFLAENKVEKIIHEKKHVKLLVVDSLTGNFRAEYIGRGTLADRQQKLNKHMHVLSKIADMYNIVVLVTNQVMAKPDSFFGDPTEPIGGHIVGHNSTFRIYLRRGKKGTRVAKLVDAPNLPDNEALFVIKEEGLDKAS